jgi:hypothetical protein
MRNIKQIALYPLIFICIYLILEISVRFFLPQEIVPSYTRNYTGIPNSLKANYKASMSHLGFSFHLQTFDNGLRTHQRFDYEKPPNVFRILLLGDSSFFGLGVEVNETIGFYLEKVLKNGIQDKNVEVINAGTPGWGLIECYLYLSKEGHKYSPDLIILGQFKDDVSDFPIQNIKFQEIHIEEEPKIRVRFRHMNIELTEESIISSVFWSIRKTKIFDILARSSHLLNIIRYKLSQIKLKEKKTKKLPWPKLKDLWESNRSRNKQIMTWEFENNGIVDKFSNYRIDKLTEITYLYLVKSLSRFAEKISANFMMINLPRHDEVLGIKKPNASQLLKLNLHFKVFDPRSELSKFQNKTRIPLYLLDDRHWSPAGHFLMAYLIYGYLNGWLIDQNGPMLNPYGLENIRAIGKSNARVLPIMERSLYFKFFKETLDKNIG